METRFPGSTASYESQTNDGETVLSLTTNFSQNISSLPCLRPPLLAQQAHSLIFRLKARVNHPVDSQIHLFGGNRAILHQPGKNVVNPLMTIPEHLVGRVIEERPGANASNVSRCKGVVDHPHGDAADQVFALAGHVVVEDLELEDSRVADDVHEVAGVVGEVEVEGCVARFRVVIGSCGVHMNPRLGGHVGG